jgi:hypothetical protein
MSDELNTQSKAQPKERPGIKLGGKSVDRAGWQWIMINATEKDKGDVFVSHNFIPYRVKRGIKVQVPPGVVTALSDAVQQMPVKDENGRITGMTEVLTYPFSVVAAPREEQPA